MTSWKNSGSQSTGVVWQGKSGSFNFLIIMRPSLNKGRYIGNSP